MKMQVRHASMNAKGEKQSRLTTVKYLPNNSPRHKFFPGLNSIPIRYGTARAALSKDITTDLTKERV